MSDSTPRPVDLANLRELVEVCRDYGIGATKLYSGDLEAIADEIERLRSSLSTHKACVEALRMIASLAGEPPCNCERCDCGNVDDAERMAAWRADNASAAIARAALQRGGQPVKVGDGEYLLRADSYDCPYERIGELESALTEIRDILPLQNDEYARRVFAIAAEALEPNKDALAALEALEKADERGA